MLLTKYILSTVGTILVSNSRSHYRAAMEVCLIMRESKHEQQVDELYNVCRGLDCRNADDWCYVVIKIQEESGQWIEIQFKRLPSMLNWVIKTIWGWA